ncbi:hypothetical protein [Aurantimonas coralicida]|jgi:cation transport ATPase|uniref:hypothetical protein n=1 Tax=Aurantimonas coralicida TaxID=182270 RepID=UPI001D18D284|nr:hypothetical protein [Aurantimonas coralicida]MCC4299047.1 hypothetical protein [Aurantimonas coralicida]
MTFLYAKRSVDLEPHWRTQLIADPVEHFQKRDESRWGQASGKKGGKKTALLATADVVLERSHPRATRRIIMASRTTYRKMVQNLRWAAGHNIFAASLAAGFLALCGVRLTLAVDAVPTSASKVALAIDTQLLKRIKL